MTSKHFRKFILARKIGMTQVFDKESSAPIPVTLLEAGPCWVTQIKTVDKDGYNAVQVGFQKIENINKVSKPLRHKPFRFLKEFRVKDPEKYQVGQEIRVDIFEPGEVVEVSGISKGKGFAGAVKRWGVVEKAKAHGAKDMRRVRSIGGRYPQRTIPGKKMPGRMGQERVTIKNLKVIEVDPERNLIAVSGSVPGARNSLVEIKALNHEE